MQQSSRRPPSYPQPTYAQPRAREAQPPPQQQQRSATASSSGLPPAPPPPTAPVGRARVSGVVVRTLGLKLLSVVGILHASAILMALVVVIVMGLGGDARVGLAMKTIKAQAGVGLWTWTLCAIAVSFVLGFVMLNNAIGTLSLTPWSQRATKVWATVWLALSAVAIVVNLAWVFPMLKEASPERFSSARLLAVTCAHVAAGVVWPGIVLFYVNTRHVKQAYARVAGGASAM
jgi:hypothetical protein